ncbi:unnamed protein product [Enterobius vermicularis]|uniref:Dynactin subunit 4 n=1 Tax=Enterobius vermicularis TaxID=51028 RepID=A0A0N4VKD4_ENTVE|nr:unnamed protein product [Enterobius vermicularis]
MASLLSIDKVVYECSCGEWSSLNRLYFCRHCSRLRCIYCVSVEMDSMYCPTCLDSVSTGEARLKRNRCPNCFQCPLCGVGLSMKASKNIFNFFCTTCRWSASLPSLPDGGWPEACKEDEKKLGSFLENMQNLATAEKTDRERHKYTKRRSNLGGVFSDRFGLQSIYNRRKAALFGLVNENKVESLQPTDDVPALDLAEILADSGDISLVPTLEQQIRQPLLIYNNLLPIKTSLLGRKGVRCRQCEHSLCKNEYNPSSVKFKIQVLASHYVPEVRISSVPKMQYGEWSPIYLSVLNFSASTLHLTLSPDETSDEHFVKCENFSIDLSVPNRDETAEMDEPVQAAVDLRQ